MNIKHHCGRLGRHLSHYWRHGKVWDENKDRWVVPVYFCTGHVVTEGGNGVVD